MPPTLPGTSANTTNPGSPYNWRLLKLITKLVASEEDPPRVRLTEAGEVLMAGRAKVKAGEEIGSGETFAELEGELAATPAAGKEVPFISKNVFNVMTFGVVEAGIQTIKVVGVAIKSTQEVSFEASSWSLN